MARNSRVRVSREELDRLREAKRIWYGEEVAEEVPNGKAIGAFSDFIVKDQGPPPEEVEDGGGS